MPLKHLASSSSLFLFEHSYEMTKFIAIITSHFIFVHCFTSYAWMSYIWTFVKSTASSTFTMQCISKISSALSSISKSTFVISLVIISMLTTILISILKSITLLYIQTVCLLYLYCILLSFFGELPQVSMVYDWIYL